MPTIRYKAVDCLPEDVTVALIEGDRGVTILLDERATVAELARDLTIVVQEHVRRCWRHVRYQGHPEGPDRGPRLQVISS